MYLNSVSIIDSLDTRYSKIRVYEAIHQPNGYNLFAATVAQSVRAFAPQVEDCLFEYQPR